MSELQRQINIAAATRRANEAHRKRTAAPALPTPTRTVQRRARGSERVMITGARGDIPHLERALDVVCAEIHRNRSGPLTFHLPWGGQYVIEHAPYALRHLHLTSLEALRAFLLPSMRSRIDPDRPWPRASSPASSGSSL